MPSRVQLKDTVYMPLHGQWQIVLGGSVIDIPDGFRLSAAHATVLVETPAAVTTPTAVRTVRTR